MISLLKRGFDPDVREDPHTRQLLQFFEKGYEKLEPKQAPAERPETVGSLINGLLESCVPYGLTTFVRILSDAFDVRGALFAVWAWSSRLRRSCGKKGRTSDSSEVSTSGEGHDWLSWRTSLIAHLYKGYSWLPQEEELKEKVITKEFVFVDFNAWECATCVHISLL